MERPKVGLGVIVIKDGKILFGKRKGSHGAQTWCFPGGHLEPGEELTETALREIAEEAGINVDLIDKSPISATNDIFEKEDKHFLTVYLRAKHLSGEPKILEPEKLKEWKWFSWENMPDNLFLPIINLKKQGFHPLK